MRLGPVDGRNCLLAFGLDGCSLSAFAAVDVEDLIARIVLEMKQILAMNVKADLVDLLCLFNNLIVVGLLWSSNILVRNAA